jgi:predicted P-loop ATPase
VTIRIVPPGEETDAQKARRLRAEAAIAKAEASKTAAAATAAAAALRLKTTAEKNARHERRTRPLRVAREGDDAWRDKLIISVDRDGVPHTMAVMANVVTILRHHPLWRGVLAWDAFAERVAHAAPPPWDPTAAPEAEAKERRESDLARVVDWLDRNEHLHVSTRLVAEAVAVVAETRTVHPVKDYLESLPAWDGKPRIYAWLSTYGGAQHSRYSAAVGSRWLISAVARVMRPGCQVDCVLVAEGESQGTGKSSIFRTIAPDLSLYSETGVAIGDKDSYQALHGVWIFLFDELDSLKRGDLTKTKNFISAMKDHYRPSYGRAARDFLRQNVFAGSTNELDYLVDRTGNRRYWPFRVVGVIDLAGLARDRDLLWAEALHRFRDGEPWHVDTAELRALCEAEQEIRVHADPWEQMVAAWLQEPDHETEYEGEHGPKRHRVPFKIPADGPSTAEILQHALRHRPDGVSNAASKRAAEVLRTLGYTRISQPWVDGVRVRRYARPLTGEPMGGDFKL